MITPRPYLSYTQLDALTKSEAEYIARYFQKKTIFNKGIELGKEIADHLESGQSTGDPVKDLVIAKIPKFELMDKPFNAEIEVQGLKIPLYGKFDTAKRTLMGIKEIKTGVTSWNQAKVDKCVQITFYVTMAYAITGKIPDDLSLIYCPAVWEGDKTVLTGEVIVFKTHRTMADILQMKIKMHNAWVRIGEITEQQLFQ